MSGGGGTRLVAGWSSAYIAAAGRGRGRGEDAVVNGSAKDGSGWGADATGEAGLSVRVKRGRSGLKKGRGRM